MKTLRTLFYLIASLAVVLTANAEQNTVLKLKDGSTIYGNIIVQRPGVDITIVADSAMFIIEDNQLHSSTSKKVKYENLSRDWKRWSLEKKALMGNANGRFMMTYDIKTKNYTFFNVVKLESPKEGFNKYFSVETSTYKFLWNDLTEIIRSLPTSNDNLYIDDEVTTSKGKTYQGTIVSQIIGKQLSIRTTNGTHIIPLEDVVETRRVSHQGSFKVNEIADYTNTLVLNNDIYKEGIILSQHYGKKSKDKYVTLLLPNGNTEKIQSNNIIEYRTKYNKKKGDIYKVGRVYVNEFLIGKAKTKNEGTKTLFVDKKVFPFPEGIVITFKSQGAKLQNDWYLVALESLSMESGGTTHGYTPEIKDSNSIRPSSTDLVDGVSSISFNYLSPGYYALVTSTGTETYIIKITK
ncbi:hypothetical protein [Sodaliphilus sp.]|uniref:hypothetical protein n=1 Tax=Sodaliphilus sp. TaxID=2815818 RepID=UPI003890FB12